MLVQECENHGVDLRLKMSVKSISDSNDGFSLETSEGEIQCYKLVIATGGLSIPPIGATDFGYSIAKQYSHKIVQTDPALVPFTMEKPLSELSGVSLPVLIETGKKEIEEDLLFTHKGMSGPAVLKISLHWHPGERIKIDFTKGMKIEHIFTQSKKNVLSVLSEKFPKRFIEMVLAEVGVDSTRSLSELSKKDQNRIYEFLSNYNFIPSGTEGFRKAEVTRGGVNVKDISSQSMESKLRSGLYFIGEVLDVTGQLGGYNFQWAWASAHAFAESLE
jgi:predicted Rossmann fold flavoprotein